MAHLLPSPKMQFFDLNGDPLSGGKVHTYEATTSTRKATYTTAAAAVANTNPVNLDDRGEADIFWSTGVYKITVTDIDDNEIYTVDSITLPATGPAGSSFRSGSGAPSDALGADGDRYLRSDTGQIYLKDESVYTVESTIALPASAVTNTPSGNLAAVTVQNALNELQTELDTATAHIADAADAHAGTAITNTPSGNLAATTVQAALNELQTDIDGRATTTLNNLGTTAINASLLLGSNDALDIANATNFLRRLYLLRGVYRSGGSIWLDAFENRINTNDGNASIYPDTKLLRTGTHGAPVTKLDWSGTTDIIVGNDAGLIKFKDSSRAGATNGYVWSLADQTTGAGGWAAASGGGGGGALSWIERANAPQYVSDNDLDNYIFIDADTQYLYTQVRVPSSYIAGSQVSLLIPFYSAGTGDTVLIQTLATLIRSGTDAVTSTTNQHTSTNSAVTLSAGTVNEPQAVVCDLSDSDGEINSVAIAAGDIIKVRLTRDTTTDTSAVDAYVLPYAAEVTFA